MISKLKLISFYKVTRLRTKKQFMLRNVSNSRKFSSIAVHALNKRKEKYI